MPLIVKHHAQKKQQTKDKPEQTLPQGTCAPHFDSKGKQKVESRNVQVTMASMNTVYTYCAPRLDVVTGDQRLGGGLHVTRKAEHGPLIYFFKKDRVRGTAEMWWFL